MGKQTIHVPSQFKQVEGGLGGRVVEHTYSNDSYDVNLRIKLKDLLGKAGLDIAPVVEGILGEQKELIAQLQDDYDHQLELRLTQEWELTQADRENDQLQQRNDNQFEMIREKDKQIEDLQARIRNLRS